MADALVSAVVEELCSMAKDEVGLLLGVKKEVKKLSSKFSAIQAVLEDAERKQMMSLAGETVPEDAERPQVRDWLGKLKEVAYEVEDILDEWRTDAFRSQGDEDDILNRKKVRSGLCFPYLCFKQVELRNDIGHRIREITERLNEISEEKRDFKLEPDNTNEPVSMPRMEKRESSSCFDESGIFGRDQEKENIINELVNETGQEEKSISIVSIVGMGGLGKTTLAQLVYNDERVKKHFQKRIWVCVSDPFNVNTVATKIIQSMGGSTSMNSDLDTMQRNLREVAGELRFLLVLDDVWDESGAQWEKLRLPLKGAAQGSKIVVTTRSHNVAKVMGTIHFHNLDQLPHSDCWKLFKSRALKGIRDEESQELIEVGEKIVERCKGVPLAVQTVGSLLGCKRDLWYWRRVLRSEIWEWKPCDEGGILPALLLSYHNLPLHLKRCFSFCSVLPKDYEIKKDELVKLWMAHGFIKYKKEESEESEEIEEIGEMYFDDLLTRSLFQEAEKENDENIVLYKMHDLVHGLALFVTAGDYCNMEIGNSKLHSVNCHHLSLLVDYDVSTIPSPLCNAERLRTLLLFGSSSIEAVPNSLFKHLKFLRALDLSDTSIEDLPSLIRELKHLRYLNLCNSKIKELPEFVTDLCNLQTLKLNSCNELRLLPSGISKMIKLRHLEITETKNLEFLPKGLGRLTSLRSLCKFPVGDENKGCKIGELENLNLLRGKLKIQNLERVMDGEEARKAKLNKKCELQSVSLHCESKKEEEWRILGDDEMKRMESMFEVLLPPHSNLKELEILNYAGSKFPSWLEDSMFSSLVKIKLESCKNCRLLPGLGKLPSLKYLKIYGADEVKVVGSEFYGNGDDTVQGRVFPKLEKLFFQNMRNLEEWKLTEEFGDVMSSLVTLEISFCVKLKALPDRLPNTLREVTIHFLELTSLPDGWGQLKALQTLDIRSCNKFSSLPVGLGKFEALHTLKIDECAKLASLPDELGQLKALQILKINNCPQLPFLPEGLRQLEVLHTLIIHNCPGLVSLPNGLGQLKALRTLEIYNCSQLSSFPEGLEQLDALRFLSIRTCNGLTSLPNGLGQLKSLRRLYVYACPNLKPLPNLQHLTMLKELEIAECPLVTELLEKEDWCNTSHIPYIVIDYEKIP